MRFLHSNCIVVCLVIQGSVAFAQSSNSAYKAKAADTEQKVLEQGKNYNVNIDIANHEAYFVDGEDSLMRMLNKRIVFSKEAIEAKLSSKAMLGFQVNFDGKVQQVYSISKIGFGIDEQLITELSKVSFLPASQGNMPYRSEVVLEIPITAPQNSLSIQKAEE